MRAKVIPIVVSVLRIGPQETLEQEQEELEMNERIETIHTTAWLKSARILR